MPDSNRPKYSIIICAKNEEKNLPWVLQKTLSLPKKIKSCEIIVVDGHSKDKTRAIAKSFGCKVILDHGLGKGDAIRRGANKAKGRILLFLDADGSHDPKDIKKILAPVFNNTADHCSGSRMLGGSDELYRNFGQFVRLIGSSLLTLMINYHLNTRLTDCQNGFRAIKKETFKRLHLKENITTIEQEMIIKTIKMGYRIIEVPAHEYERRSGRSHVIIWKFAPRYIYSCIKYLFLS